MNVLPSCGMDFWRCSNPPGVVYATSKTFETRREKTMVRITAGVVAPVGVNLKAMSVRLNAEVVVHTDTETVEESTEKILKKLEQMGYLNHSAKAAAR